MDTLLNSIEQYWTGRTDGYDQVNQKELEGMQKEAWAAVLERELPDRANGQIHILDVGCGPGFFLRILAERGYTVTGVDYTPSMLKKAGENLREFAPRVTLERMDAQRLKFPDHVFDAVISRNLTWNLKYPADAYREWHRVLKPGGKLVNFDANWYGYLFDEEKRAAYNRDRLQVKQEHMEDHYLCTDIDAMEKIALQVPLSGIRRPEWDRKVLEQQGFQDIRVDSEIWKRVWSKEEQLNYGSTPMFMITGIKAFVQ